MKARYNFITAVLTLLIWVQPAMAADADVPVVLAFSADGQGVTRYGAWQQAVLFDRQVAANATSGARLRIQLDAGEAVVFTVSRTGAYINGERFLRGHGDFHGESLSLSLTLGADSVFGYLNSSHAVYQLAVTRQAGQWRGWLSEPGALDPGQKMHNDYWIPSATASELRRPQAQSAPLLPLSTAASGELNSLPDNDRVALDNSTLRLTQQLTPSPVIVGDGVTATVTVENISAQTQRGLDLEIFFFLENSTLASAPAQCREQLSLSLQEILYCELGDFAPGQVKTFSYAFTTSADSLPAVMTTLLIDELRVDDYVNVVQDVRLDSDGDGISDFNEALLATDPLDAASVDLGTTVVDVMALYTPGSEALYPHGVETRINQLISVANQIYADSGVAITLRPVYHGRIDYPDNIDMETALNSLLSRSHGAFAPVDSLRSEFGADLVMLLRPLGDEDGRCGLAPVGGYGTNGDFSSVTEREFAFSVIGIDCPDDVVVAHELGHNMGLTHSYREDGTGGTFEFATGYGVDGGFATVMALPAAFGVDARLGRFSSPDSLCQGFICGVGEGLAEAADAVLTLNTVRHQIAAYMPQRVPGLPGLILKSLSGRQPDANIAVAATTDGGLSFTTAVAPGEAVDVFADIMLDPLHVGMQGSVHVLILAEDGTYFQVDGVGRLMEWDGSAQGLKSAVASGPLRTHERLSILNDFVVDAAAAGQVIEFYVAYQFAEFSDVVYTAEPLRLTVTAANP
ncbi:MAG: reprolysin-like metallopeptidase [Pseudohongiellaceae bacterium]